MRVTQMSAFSDGKLPEERKNIGFAYSAPKGAQNRSMGSHLKNIFAEFETDDCILAAIIVILILEGCDDYILLAALGYLFLAGIKEPQKGI